MGFHSITLIFSTWLTASTGRSPGCIYIHCAPRRSFFNPVAQPAPEVLHPIRRALLTAVASDDQLFEQLVFSRTPRERGSRAGAATAPSSR